MRTDIYKIFGERVRAERLGRGWTIEDLAEAARISNSFLSYVEQNKKKCSLATVQKLAEAFQIPISELVKELPLRPRKRRREAFLINPPARKRKLIRRIIKAISQD